MTKPVFGVSDKDSNQSPQLQRLACSMFRYDTFREMNNKGTDQIARMCCLVCAFFIRTTPKTGFLTSEDRFSRGQGPYNTDVGHGVATSNLNVNLLPF